MRAATFAARLARRLGVFALAAFSAAGCSGEAAAPTTRVAPEILDANPRSSTPPPPRSPRLQRADDLKTLATKAG
jgi:hypothetical protein